MRSYFEDKMSLIWTFQYDNDTASKPKRWFQLLSFHKKCMENCEKKKKNLKNNI